MINRGGEKISPLEVDSALLSVDGVKEAVCFGVEDEKYGEIVWAAVVLSKPDSAAEKRIQAALAGKISKVGIIGSSTRRIQLLTDIAALPSLKFLKESSSSRKSPKVRPARFRARTSRKSCSRNSRTTSPKQDCSSRVTRRNQQCSKSLLLATPGWGIGGHEESDCHGAETLNEIVLTSNERVLTSAKQPVWENLGNRTIRVR